MLESFLKTASLLLPLLQYIGLMVFLLVLQIGGGVFLFVFRGRVKDAVTSVLVKEGIVRYRDDQDLQNIIDWTQEKVIYLLRY